MWGLCKTNSALVVLSTNPILTLYHTYLRSVSLFLQGITTVSLAATVVTTNFFEAPLKPLWYGVSRKPTEMDGKFRREKADKMASNIAAGPENSTPEFFSDHYCKDTNFQKYCCNDNSIVHALTPSASDHPAPRLIPATQRATATPLVRFNQGIRISNGIFRLVALAVRPRWRRQHATVDCRKAWHGNARSGQAAEDTVGLCPRGVPKSESSGAAFSMPLQQSKRGAHLLLQVRVKTLDR